MDVWQVEGGATVFRHELRMLPPCSSGGLEWASPIEILFQPLDEIDTGDRPKRSHEGVLKPVEAQPLHRGNVLLAQVQLKQNPGFDDLHQFGVNLGHG